MSAEEHGRRLSLSRGRRHSGRSVHGGDATTTARNDSGSPVPGDAVRVAAAAPAAWIRGVNLGGWLVLERYITPYLFAVTDCHLAGRPCWYRGQLAAPDASRRQRQPNGDAADDDDDDDDDMFHEHGEDRRGGRRRRAGSREAETAAVTSDRICDLRECRPHRVPNVLGEVDYPLDEYTLSQAFAESGINGSTAAAEAWLNRHFETFVSRRDLEDLAAAGATHLRVPLPHFILGDVRPGEPWLPADRWRCLTRVLDWCRELRLQVWPDLHTAPGSQNGFDNSGRTGSHSTCTGWSQEPANVDRLLAAIRAVARRLREEGYGDVVTGFGLLNEPFKDCDRHVYDTFLARGLAIVRQELGEHTHVYISDMFLAKMFNKGFWLDPKRYHDTYLDSHYYHVFEEVPRSLSPRQHIAYVCTNEKRDVIACCYEDHPRNRVPSRGVRRMVGEWSVAVDTLPASMLRHMMDTIAATGVVAGLERQIPRGRQQFLRHFAEAQMVAYESADVGTTAAWFYWNFKMEGGAFAEWDFLRGVREGWLPRIPPPDVPSVAAFGTCYDILFRTNDTMEVIHEYPDPRTPGLWIGNALDDDVVISHGENLLPQGERHPITPEHHGLPALVWVALAVATAGVAARWVSGRRGRKAQYTSLDSEISM